MAIKKRPLTILREDVGDFVVARVIMIEPNILRVIFKSKTDMHLYKISGKYGDGNVPDPFVIEFRYGLWQRFISHFINRDWGRNAVFVIWFISSMNILVRIFHYLK